jgi:questin oxidase-like protein
MDQALEMMAKLAPLTNHGPMAAEALIALGRPESVATFVEGYLKRFTAQYPAPFQAVTQKNWREALGDGRRVADWANFFQSELKERPWRQVLEQWSAALAPGLSAAAAHGLLRTGHAVRSLAVKETDLRLRELAQGLSYWAAYYQLLPETSDMTSEHFTPALAIDRIPLLPNEKRAGSGSIMILLRSLQDFPQFADTANLVQPGENAEAFLSQVTEGFAGVYVKNVTQKNFITLIHSVTGTTVLRSMVPHLSAATTRKLLHYGWQMAAGLYSISGIGRINGPVNEQEIKRDDLIDRAVALREEHAIKFTEACLREYALNPKPVYLQAARDALDRLRQM